MTETKKALVPTPMIKSGETATPPPPKSKASAPVASIPSIAIEGPYLLEVHHSSYKDGKASVDERRRILANELPLYGTSTVKFSLKGGKPSFRLFGGDGKVISEGTFEGKDKSQFVDVKGSDTLTLKNIDFNHGKLEIAVIAADQRLLFPTVMRG